MRCINLTAGHAYLKFELVHFVLSSFIHQSCLKHLDLLYKIIFRVQFFLCISYHFN